MFLIYRYLASTIGIAKIGVWSVVIASASTARIADLGLSIGVTRFVAKYLTVGENERAAKIIETGIITVSATSAIVFLITYPFLSKILCHIFNPKHIVDAEKLLPYALFSLWITIVSEIIQSGLDGCQRMVARACLVVGGQSLLLVSAILLVPEFGIIGLAWAQIGQGIFIMIFGWCLLRHNLPFLSQIPVYWKLNTFREMFRYGFNVQISSFVMILFDPLTKVLMTRFGGATAAGYFEMASQIAIKLRSLIIFANKAIVPKVTQINEISPIWLPKIYQENLKVLILISLPVFTLFFAWSDWFSSRGGTRLK